MAVAVVGGSERLSVDYRKIIGWLARARCEDHWVDVPDTGSGDDLPWGSHGICIRESYKKFEDVVMTSWPDGEHCCVVTGTPGIGKSTLLYYLLWKFMHKGLKDYQTVVYGDANCLFYMQQDSTPGRWLIQLFDAELGHEFEGPSLGLVDAPVDCQLPGRKLNDQNVVARLCVNHLMIAASAGLLQKHSDLRKATRQTRVLPAWQPEALHHWCCQRCGLPEPEWEARVQLCGDAVPRLVLASNVPKQEAWKEKFDFTLKIFLKAIHRITLQGLDAAPQDAHTLLILQPSPQLAEEPGEALARPEAGEMLRYVSAYVQREVHRSLTSKRQLAGFLRAIPQAAPFAFEELVLKWLTKAGLEVHSGKLKMDTECWLEGFLAARSEPQLNVLYRPRSRHYPSIHAFAVLMRGADKSAYFIQITTALEHFRVQLRHVDALLQSASAKEIVCLYVVPAQPELKLKDGDNPLRAGTDLGTAKWREEIALAEVALARFPKDVQAIIRGGHGDASAARRPAVASTGRPAKRLRRRPAASADR